MSSIKPTPIKDPIDWNICLRACNNKHELANEILDVFQNELPSLQQLIHQSAEKKAYSSLSKHSHKLQGSCRYCGAVQLCKYLEQLDHTIFEKNYKNIPALIKTIETEIQEILAVLRNRS